MLPLCCQAFSFQYYRVQTGCDWLLLELQDYMPGLEPGLMKTVPPTGTDQLHSAAPWRQQGEGQAQPGYKFRQLSVMQACYLKPSETRPSRDGYYGCHSQGDRLSVGWQWGGDEIKAGQACWSLLIYSVLVIIYAHTVHKVGSIAYIATFYTLKKTMADYFQMKFK